MVQSKNLKKGVAAAALLAGSKIVDGAGPGVAPAHGSVSGRAASAGVADEFIASFNKEWRNGYLPHNHGQVKATGARVREEVAKHCDFSLMPAQAYNDFDRMVHLVGKGKERDLMDKVDKVTPMLLGEVHALILKFLRTKIDHGSKKEKKFYRKHFFVFALEEATTPEKNTQNESAIKRFIERLFKKRPLVFWKYDDDHVIFNGENNNPRDSLTGEIFRDTDAFQRIGTDNEHGKDYYLENLISAHDRDISSLLGVMVPTFFYNDGARNKMARYKNADFEEEGVYVAQVGSRFEKPGHNEWKHMMVTAEQNTCQNGYGSREEFDSCANRTAETTQQFHLLQAFAQMYGVKCFPTPGNPERCDLSPGQITADGLNTKVLEARSRQSGKMLFEAAKKAVMHEREVKRDGSWKAFVHATGVGIGVWAMDKTIQWKLLAKTYCELLPEYADYVAHLHFGYTEGLAAPGCSSLLQDGKTKEASVRVSFGALGGPDDRNPAAKLVERSAWKKVGEKLVLVANYAWDGNSQAGNEYYLGALRASGDPAAMASSNVAVFQNPFINGKAFSEARIAVLPALDHAALTARMIEMTTAKSKPTLSIATRSGAGSASAGSSSGSSAGSSATGSAQAAKDQLDLMNAMEAAFGERSTGTKNEKLERFAKKLKDMYGGFEISAKTIDVFLNIRLIGKLLEQLKTALISLIKDKLKEESARAYLENATMATIANEKGTLQFKVYSTALGGAKPPALIFAVLRNDGWAGSSGSDGRLVNLYRGHAWTLVTAEWYYADTKKSKSVFLVEGSSVVARGTFAMRELMALAPPDLASSSSSRSDEGRAGPRPLPLCASTHMENDIMIPHSKQTNTYRCVILNLNRRNERKKMGQNGKEWKRMGLIDNLHMYSIN